MDVAITGSHGMIGSALTTALRADGHRVIPVVRGPSANGGRSVRWDPAGGTIDAAGLEGVDAVVNLAGASLDGLWTDDRKRRIRDSRVQGTRLLSEALAGLDRQPPVLVSASGTSIYGDDRGDEVLTEDSPEGEGFMGDVCRGWEAATAPAEAAGIRLAKLRSGVVLSADGGALGKQLLPFKLGLGGRAGSGQQWMSWITLADEVAAIRFLIDNDVAGPVNLATPNPIRNVEWAKTLGSVLGRPTVIPIPRLAGRLPLGVGELAESLLFSSWRVAPAVLMAHRFPFQYPDLRPALEAVLA